MIKSKTNWTAATVTASTTTTTITKVISREGKEAVNVFREIWLIFLMHAYCVYECLLRNYYQYFRKLGIILNYEYYEIILILFIFTKTSGTSGK